MTLFSNQPITALRLTSPAHPCTYGTFCLQYKNKPMAAPTATRTAMTIPAMAPSERPSRAPSSGTPEHRVNNGEQNHGCATWPVWAGLTFDGQAVCDPARLAGDGVVRLAGVRPRVFVDRFLNDVRGCRDGGRGSVEPPGEVGGWHRGGGACERHFVVDLDGFLAAHLRFFRTIWGETRRILTSWFLALFRASPAPLAATPRPLLLIW